MSAAVLPVQVLGLSPDSPFVTSSRLDALSLAEKEALLPALEQRCAERAREYSRRCQSVLSRRSGPDLARGAEQRREIAEREDRAARERARELEEDAARLARSLASLTAAEEGRARLERSRRGEEAATLARGYREAQERREAALAARRSEQREELRAAREAMARGAEAARRVRERKVAAGAEAKRACLEEAQRRREQRAAERGDEIDPFESSYQALDRSTRGVVGGSSVGAGAAAAEATAAEAGASAPAAASAPASAPAPAASSRPDRSPSPGDTLRVSALSPALSPARPRSAEPGASAGLGGTAGPRRTRVRNYAGPEDDTPALQQKEAQRREFVRQAHRDSLEQQARRREEAYAALQVEKAQFYDQYRAMAEAVRTRRAQRVQAQKKYHAELDNAEKARKLAEDIRRVDEAIERKKREYAAQREEARRLADARAAERARVASERSREAEERHEREVARRFAAAFDRLHSM